MVTMQLDIPCSVAQSGIAMHGSGVAMHQFYVKGSLYIDHLQEYEISIACRVPSQSKSIAKYLPYKESNILLIVAVAI